MTDDTTLRLTDAAKRHTSDRARLARSRDNLADLVRMAVRHGMTESEAARLAGVTRMTIRKWVGK